MDTDPEVHLPAPIEPAEDGARRAASDRDAGDVRLLCALAAAHALFGRHDAASGFVALADWIDPEDRRVAELRALIDMRRGRLDAALDTIRRLRGAGHQLPDALRLIEARAVAQSIASAASASRRSSPLSAAPGRRTGSRSRT